MQLIVRVFVVTFVLTTFCCDSSSIDLQCRLTKESPDTCIVTKKGVYINDTVTIISNKSPEIKHVKVIRVNLGRIPASGLKNFRKIEAVTFEGCGIVSLDGLKSLKSVQQIFLNRNNLTAMLDAKFNSKAVYIEAQYNKLENISRNAFKNLNNLYWLDLSNNRIKKLPRKLFVHNSVLTSVNLSNNRIKNIKNVFRKQEHLRFLRLSHNKVERLTSETFIYLKNLRELDLSNNRISSIDSHTFDYCVSLFLLNLSKNLLKQLHFTIPNKGLTFLYLMDNNMFNLTIDYKENPNRLLLDTSNEKLLTDVSRSMKFKFQKGLSISSLNLANNNLDSINAVAGISKLKKLSLANNTLLANTSLIRLLTLTELIDLNVQGVNITQDQLLIILQIKSLRTLDLSKNKQLQSFEFSPPAHPLTKIVLNNCNLTEINLGNLKEAFPKLREIHLSDNLFTCEYLKELLTKFHSLGIRAQISNLDQITTRCNK